VDEKHALVAAVARIRAAASAVLWGFYGLRVEYQTMQIDWFKMTYGVHVKGSAWGCE
jgi:hypothetical protein